MVEELTMKESENTKDYDTDFLKCDANPLKHTEIYQLKDSDVDNKNASQFEVKGRDEQATHYEIFDEYSANDKNGSIDSPIKEGQNGFLHDPCTWEIDDDDEPPFSSFNYKKQDSKDPVHESLAGTEIPNESRDLHSITYYGSSNPFLDYSDHHQYTDKTVVECENYHVIKDICVDMGISEKGKITTDNHDSTNPFLEAEENNLENAYTDHTNGVEDTHFLTPEEINHSTGHDVCERTDDQELSDQMFYEQQVSESSKASSVLDQRAFPEEDTNPNNNISDNRQVQDNTKLETTTENAQEQSTLIDEDLRNFKESSNDSQIHHRNDETQEKNEGRNFDNDQCPENRNTASDDHSSENQLSQNAGSQIKIQLQHDELGETSFSAASLVAYSGPILAYSGSISHRSDASTASGRSFAFPVLQSEWNTSPVRMAKADRRHFRKHKGWRSGLLCCRF